MPELPIQSIEAVVLRYMADEQFSSLFDIQEIVRLQTDGGPRQVEAGAHRIVERFLKMGWVERVPAEPVELLTLTEAGAHVARTLTEASAPPRP